MQSVIAWTGAEQTPPYPRGGLYDAARLIDGFSTFGSAFSACLDNFELTLRIRPVAPGAVQGKNMEICLESALFLALPSF